MAVYVHIPFCKSFCTYCDFYSELCPETESAQAQNLFVQEVLGEVRDRQSEIASASAPATLYFGGGTPSLLSADAIRQIAEAVGGGPWEEFTVEVNPEDIVRKGISYVKGLLAAGVNRISMGIQSTDDGILKWMNRRHDSAGARQAVRILREAGVRNLSVDLIFGLSQLTMETWEHTIDDIIGMAPEHISAYQLSIEEGSTLADLVANGRYTEASGEKCRGQYDLLCRKLSEAGYIHYEISNFAKPGFEAVHNSAYWSRAPYVGLGPGAHSFDGRTRSWNSCDKTGWTREFEILSPEDIRIEEIMLPLRTSAGLDNARLICNPEALEEMLHEGALIEKKGRIRIPESHFFVSDDIIRKLI